LYRPALHRLAEERHAGRPAAPVSGTAAKSIDRQLIFFYKLFYLHLKGERRGLPADVSCLISPARCGWHFSAGDFSAGD
jgi:hypothetical protein